MCINEKQNKVLRSGALARKGTLCFPSLSSIMTSSFSWCSTFPAQTQLFESIGEAQNTSAQSARSKLLPITGGSTEGGEKPRAGLVSPQANS